jgi:hypothetical protein
MAPPMLRGGVADRSAANTLRTAVTARLNKDISTKWPCSCPAEPHDELVSLMLAMAPLAVQRGSSIMPQGS